MKKIGARVNPISHEKGIRTYLMGQTENHFFREFDLKTFQTFLPFQHPYFLLYSVREYLKTLAPLDFGPQIESLEECYIEFTDEQGRIFETTFGEISKKQALQQFSSQLCQSFDQLKACSQPMIHFLTFIALSIINTSYVNDFKKFQSVWVLPGFIHLCAKLHLLGQGNRRSTV